MVCLHGIHGAQKKKKKRKKFAAPPPFGVILFPGVRVESTCIILSLHRRCTECTSTNRVSLWLITRI